MTAQEALKRNEKSQWLKVWQVDDTWFYVESEMERSHINAAFQSKGLLQLRGFRITVQE